MSVQIDLPKGRFDGHARNKLGQLEPDDLLHRVGPGSPCGEYLRRFWQPIALASMVKDRPLRLRRLGENLVLFRERGGRLGLLHLNCCHRNASLEYGVIEEGGIRCCYHGWKYDIDGTILETPAEPPTSRIRERVRQGAYPAVEYKGMIFAYFGPPAEQPPIPVLDTWDWPDDTMVPFLIPSPVNWLQVSENSIDPYHVPFLHARVTGVQFQDNFGHIGVINYHERDIGFFYTTARRVGPMIWVRVHDHLFPNFSQNGGMWTEGDQSVYFARTGLTRWVVPVDDTNTIVIAWRHFNKETDPFARGDPSQCGYDSVDFYGQTGHRPYELKQSNPGDYEAWGGQGPITVHARENLGHSDQGVASLRRRLRNAIRKLEAGEAPLQPSLRGAPVHTYAGDTVLAIPKSNEDDRALCDRVSQRMAEIYRSGDGLMGEARRTHIVAGLKELERSRG